MPRILLLIVAAACASGAGGPPVGGLPADEVRFAPNRAGSCPGSSTTRDQATGAVSLEGTGIVPVSNGVYPHMPPSMRGGPAGHVVASFAIDTTGRIVPTSVAILEATDPRYASAVCDALRRIRFTPFAPSAGAATIRVNMPFEFVTSR